MIRPLSEGGCGGEEKESISVGRDGVLPLLRVERGGRRALVPPGPPAIRLELSQGGSKKQKDRNARDDDIRDPNLVTVALLARARPEGDTRDGAIFQGRVHDHSIALWSIAETVD